MTEPQVSEEIVTEARRVFRAASMKAVIREGPDPMRAALEAVTPALRVSGAEERDAEIKRNDARWAEAYSAMKTQRDAARAEGATEVRAAVEAVCADAEAHNLGVPGLSHTSTKTVATGIDRIRAAISPEGVTAHNTTIATQTLDSAIAAVWRGDGNLWAFPAKRVVAWLTDLKATTNTRGDV